MKILCIEIIHSILVKHSSMDESETIGIDSHDIHADGLTVHYTGSGWCLPSGENCSALASFPRDPPSPGKSKHSQCCVMSE